MTPVSRRAAWNAAVTWVHAHGGIVDARLCYDDARDCDGGVKVCRGSALEVDSTTIIGIPSRLWVTRRLASESPTGQRVVAAIDSIMQAGIALNSSHSDIIIAFHVAAVVFHSSTGSTPFHAPYYTTLPTGDDDPRVMLPRCWGDAGIDALLRGSPAAAEAKRARAASWGGEFGGGSPISLHNVPRPHAIPHAIMLRYPVP